MLMVVRRPDDGLSLLSHFPWEESMGLMLLDQCSIAEKALSRTSHALT